MKITQSFEDYHHPSTLQRDLQAWFAIHPFKNGIDHEFEYYWATMTDEDAVLFCLKYPEHTTRFKKETNVKTKANN